MFDPDTYDPFLNEEDLVYTVFIPGSAEHLRLAWNNPTLQVTWDAEQSLWVNAITGDVGYHYDAEKDEWSVLFWTEAAKAYLPYEAYKSYPQQIRAPMPAMLKEFYAENSWLLKD